MDRAASYITASGLALMLLGGSLIGTGQAADVGFFVLLKGQQFDQNTASAPTPSQVVPPFALNVFVSLATPGGVTAGSVRLPNGTDQTLAVTSANLSLSGGFVTQGVMDTSYPDGDYQFTFDTVDDGTNTVTLNLSGDSYPPAPYITNFLALQNVNPAADLNLGWSPWPGGTTNDFIQIEIEGSSGTVYATPGLPSVAGSLAGTAVSTTIPANTLAPGQTYLAVVIFAHVVAQNTTAYPGVLGVAAYTSSTAFPLTTGGGSAEPDVQAYVLRKRESFTQTNADAPMPDGATPFALTASVLASATNRVTTAQLQPPGGSPVNLTNLSDGITSAWQQKFTSDADLTAAYPTGTYGFTIQTIHDGTKNVALDLPAAAYPNAPHINNYAAAQTVNAAANFRLGWDSFVGGTTNDAVQVTLTDPQTGQTLLQSPLPGIPTALDGTTTSLLIPANFLVPNHAYRIAIEFMKVLKLDTANYPGVLGVSCYSSRTTLSLTTAPGPATTDLIGYHVIKGQLFTQNGTGAPVLQSGTPFVFDATAQMNSLSSVTNGSLQLPNGTVLPFMVQFGQLQLTQNYATQTNLDNADPDGNYTFTFNTVHNGTQTSSLNLSGNTYPSPPHLSNYNAAQAVNAGADFTLAWDPFVGGTMRDFIVVDVVDPSLGLVFSTDGPGTPNALNGTVTSVVIPANRLSPGTTYQATVLFIKTTTFDTNSYPGVYGVAGYLSQTRASLTTASNVVNVDVRNYAVRKGRQFVQTSANAPSPLPAAPYLAEVAVLANNSNAVAGATVQRPTGSASALTTQDGGLSFQWSHGFTNQISLETAFPDGTYHLTLLTLDDGTKNLPLTLAGDTYPPVPQISDFAAAQAIDAASDFTLTWDPLLDNPTNIIVELSVRDSTGHLVFQSPQIGQTGLLTGANTALVIPANTLAAGQHYSATLRFEQGTLDTTSYPGATGFAGYFEATTFTLVTQPGTVIPAPSLLIPVPLADGTIRVRLIGQPNHAYQIQASSDLSTWTTLTNGLSGADGSLDLLDTHASAFQQRFYRGLGD